MEIPDTARFNNDNNKSAINNSKFVENPIKEMLATGTILEQNHSLRVVNPLLVSIDASGKKASHFGPDRSMHLYKDKIKFGDWKCFENYLLANKGYLLKFNLKNGDPSNISRLFLRYQRDYKISRIHCPTLSFILCTIYLYKSSTSFREELAFARCKNCLFSWRWFRYSIHISRWSFLL